MLKKINYILSKKEKISFVVLAFLLLIGGIFDLLGISLILPVIYSITDPEFFFKNEYILILKKYLSINGDKSFTVLFLILLILVYILKNVYIIFMYYVMYKIIWKYKENLSLRMLKCYMYQNYYFFTQKNVSDLHRNILTDVGQFYGFIMDVLNALNQIVICLMLTVYLFYFDFITTCWVILVLGFFASVLYIFQKKNQSIRGKINREANASLNKWILQSFAGIKEIKILSREPFFIRRCKEEYIKGMDANRKSNLSLVIPKPIMEVTLVCGLISVILFRLVLNGNIQDFISILAVFAFAAFRMLPCFNSISAYLSSMFFEKDSVVALYNDIVEMEKMPYNTDKFHENLTLSFNNSIDIVGLSYKYPLSNKWILKNIGLTIQKNSSIGFVGASGSGKSTLIDIIIGLLKPNDGFVTVDGVDIERNINGWHNLVGYIPQNIYFMDDSIKNNVAFGIEPDKISEELIWKALEEAQIADFVRTMPDGINSQIGDRGVMLSGGQRQRLGIARALYKDPQILVFDEATSALDNETESALMKSIEGLKGKRTVLIIAHRLNTIQNCDCVYEIKNSSLVRLR